jgi:chromosome segregation ATPase
LEHVELAKVDASTHEILTGYYQSQCIDLCMAFSFINKELADIQATTGQHAIDLASALTCNESLTSRLESLQKEHDIREEELKLALATRNDLKAATTSLEAQVAEMQHKLDDSNSSHANDLKKEKDTIHRLNTTIQKTRMAEEAFRDEIDE